MAIRLSPATCCRMYVHFRTQRLRPERGAQSATKPITISIRLALCPMLSRSLRHRTSHRRVPYRASMFVWRTPAVLAKLCAESSSCVDLSGRSRARSLVRSGRWATSVVSSRRVAEMDVSFRSLLERLREVTGGVGAAVESARACCEVEKQTSSPARCFERQRG